MNISATTRLLAVIGDPVGHSLSPLMQNGWIEDCGLDAVYVGLRLRDKDPAAAIRALGSFGFIGANVTVPHKEAAARAADRSEGDVANVLRWEEDGSLSAFNTDGPGFLDSLDESAPGWRERVKAALVVGAGGAAQGIGKALSPYVQKVVFTNRTAARAEAAAKQIPNGDTSDWERLDTAFGQADLIVQTTTLGMEGQPDRAWPVAACRPDAIACDVVYRPLETGFLRAARQKGLLAVDGLGMLIHQGVRSFELWFGVRPDVEKGRKRLEAAVA